MLAFVSTEACLTLPPQPRILQSLLVLFFLNRSNRGLLCPYGSSQSDFLNLSVVLQQPLFIEVALEYKKRITLLCK